MEHFLRYRHFLNQWSSNHAPYLFIFKNEASIPAEFFKEFTKFQEENKNRLFLKWFGCGQFLHQEGRVTAEQEKIFSEIFYNIIVKNSKNFLLVTTWNAILQRYPSIEAMLQGTMMLSVGETIDKRRLEMLYGEANYRQLSTMPKFLSPNTFHKTREAFCVGFFEKDSSTMVKVSWFGDVIESIEIKTSKEEIWRTVNSVEIFSKFGVFEDSMGQKRLIDWFEQQKKYKTCSRFTPQLPKFLGPWRTIFWGNSATILDWLPKETRMVFFDDPIEEIKNFWEFLKREDDQYLEDSRWLRPPLVERWIGAAEFFSHPSMHSAIIADEEKDALKKIYENFLKKSEDFGLWLSKHSYSLDHWICLLNKKSFSEFIWVFLAKSSESALKLKHALKNKCEKIKESSAAQLIKEFEYCSNIEPIYILIEPSLTKEAVSLFFSEKKIVFLSEHFFPTPASTSIVNLEAENKSNEVTENIDFIENFINLIPFNVNDYVVHYKHGIGRFLGIKEIEIKNSILDFCALEYANEAKIYVPVFSISKIHAYALSSQENVELTNLECKRWEKTKLKAAEHAKDVAAMILKQRAEKRRLKGKIIARDELQEKLFAEQCGFTETSDQIKAINAVLNDLASEKLMDRLICGEVGFGKTEVALRAAFNAIFQKKQVMVLAPTTLLAQQHYDRFVKRFENFSVKIACLSRFCSAKECKNILEESKSGKIDILIGTHKLLNKQLEFKDLGLFVLDEEHRFGVLQKEILTALTDKVDRLTLTATPIPRTLSMAMHGLKDLSLIMTPPYARQPVETVTGEMNSEECLLAIHRELEQGGQVYYVSNRIDDHPKIVERLQKAFPQAQVSYVHGQLPVKILESRMLDYYHNKINILVCSIIIETGIDIANANTLIVEDADRFGLAQLHQLRGRVGRSTRQAYAYFFYSKEVLKSKAKQRLEALSRFSGLGAGFMLAEQDLEMRGAGNLLGEAQSGKSGQVGIGLYLELVSQEVKNLNNQSHRAIGGSRCELDLGEEFSLSKKDIPQLEERLMWYRKFSLVNNLHQFEILKSQFYSERPCSSVGSNLFLESLKIQLKGSELGIISIKHKNNEAIAQFQNRINTDLKKLSIDLKKNFPDVLLWSKDPFSFSWKYPRQFSNEKKLAIIILLIDFLGR